MGYFLFNPLVNDALTLHIVVKYLPEFEPPDHNMVQRPWGVYS
jgi:hypothetical protein